MYIPKYNGVYIFISVLSSEIVREPVVVWLPQPCSLPGAPNKTLLLHIFTLIILALFFLPLVSVVCMYVCIFSGRNLFMQMSTGNFNRLHLRINPQSCSSSGLFIELSLPSSPNLSMELCELSAKYKRIYKMLNYVSSHFLV